MTTSQPSNQSELQLYRVLQRANLLNYYDTFIGQGGDDVQQLCEAGEEEFLEIMALVGMASKPLHVRRLQKALQEWVTTPALFQQPLVSLSSPAPVSGSILASITPSSRSPVSVYQISPTNMNLTTSWTNSQTTPKSSASSSSSSSSGNAGGNNGEDQSPTSPPVIVMDGSHGSRGTPSPTFSLYNVSDRTSSTSPQPTPVLTESQIHAISIAARQLAQSLPAFERKPMNMKKSLYKDLEEVMALNFDIPQNMDIMRKYAAIYGRFDSKRKNEKPMSMHEISVNEASAQLCRHMPSLLTRREELFPLARQVVRDSGYQYAKGHSRGQPIENITPLKKPKTESCYRVIGQEEQIRIKSELARIHREQQLADLNKELENIVLRQDDIKRQLAESKDYRQIQRLQEDLDAISKAQLVLLNKQSNLLRKDARNTHRQLFPKSPPLPGSEVNLLQTVAAPQFTLVQIPPPSATIVSPSHNGIHSTPHDQSLLRLPLNTNSLPSKMIVQNTLFDEGLRIAQQYGMTDFAQELMCLQPKDNDAEDKTTDSESKKTVKQEVNEEEEPKESVESDKQKQDQEAKIECEGVNENGSESGKGTQGEANLKDEGDKVDANVDLKGHAENNKPEVLPQRTSSRRKCKVEGHSLHVAKVVAEDLSKSRSNGVDVSSNNVTEVSS